VSITIYWACIEDQWMRAKSPEPINKKFYKNKKFISKEKASPIALNYCPVFNNRIENVYAIKSIYNYSFNIENNQCISKMYDQKFFDDHIQIRSIEDKFFSFMNRYIFFTDEKSLNMGAYEYPIFEENEITKRCMMIPGEYDIGKWFRPLEFPFILKKDFNDFSVEIEDVLYYLKFYTKKNIIFKQFLMTEKLKKMSLDTINLNTYSIKRFGPIDNFYKSFKLKDKILEEIQNNIL
jgi:hypothetical protein